MTNPISNQARAARPAKIGRYRVVDRLGRGAMGIVYSAIDDVMGREVAVKVMMEDIELDPDTRTRFYREAKIAGQLMHSHIVTVFDLGEEDGRPYIVMELLRGSTLGEYLSDPEAVPLETKLDLMVQVCDGLAVTHVRNIFHRDIKPSNLFVQEDGSLKILDFGIARMASSTMTANGLVVGTPHFMSPEQARGEEIDARSDVFSAGAVFFFMLTGQRPFAAPSLSDAMRRVQFDAPSPMAAGLVHTTLEGIILKTLAKDRSMRHQSITDLRNELVAFRRSFDVETRRLAQSVAEQCRAFDAVSADIQSARIDAGLDELGVPYETSAVRARLGVLVNDVDGTIFSASFKRNELLGMIPGLEAEHQAALARRLAWHDATDAVRIAREALASQGAGLALPYFDAAIQAAPELRAFQAERERCAAVAAGPASAPEQSRGDEADDAATESFRRVHAETEKAARSAAVRSDIALCREMLSLNRLPAARKAAIRACALGDDAEPEARALLLDVVRAEAEALVAAERRRLTRLREGQVADLLAQMRAAIDAGDSERAAQAAGHASALASLPDDIFTDPVVRRGVAQAGARDEKIRAH